MTVRFTDEDGQPSNVSLNEQTGEVTPIYRIRWDRIGGIIAGVVLIVMGWTLIHAMLDLAAEPLPPCSQATIQHVCAGAP